MVYDIKVALILPSTFQEKRRTLLLELDFRKPANGSRQGRCPVERKGRETWSESRIIEQ